MHSVEVTLLTVCQQVHSHCADTGFWRFKVNEPTLLPNAANPVSLRVKADVAGVVVDEAANGLTLGVELPIGVAFLGSLRYVLSAFSSLCLG